MKNEFLWLCSSKGVSQVEILKETEKQYKLVKNEHNRTIVRKVELDTVLGDRSIIYSCVVSSSKDRAVELWNKFIEEKINKCKENIHFYKTLYIEK